MSDQLAVMPARFSIEKGKRLFVVFLIDRSGSMGDISVEAPVPRIEVVHGAYEAFLAQANKHPNAPRIRVAPVGFNDAVPRNLPVWMLRDAPSLDLQHFLPHGGTALFDAIGATIELMEKVIVHKPHYEHVGLIILSDGEENASRIWTADRVRELIQAKRTLGWNIAFYGMNEVQLNQARNIGVPAASTHRWHADRHDSVANLSASFMGSMVETVAYPMRPNDSSPQ